MDGVRKIILISVVSDARRLKSMEYLFNNDHHKSMYLTMMLLLILVQYMYYLLKRSFTMDHVINGQWWLQFTANNKTQ